MLNNLTFWNNDPEFKERERKKRLEYGFLLRQQIEEEQKRKEEEKKKREIEDLKFLNKFENRSYSNYNIHQIPLIENGNNLIINYHNQQNRDNQNQNFSPPNNNINYYNQYNQPLNKSIYNNFQYENNNLNLIPNNYNFTNQNIINPNTIQRYNYNNDYNYNYEKFYNIQEQSPIHLEIKQKEKEINIQELFKNFVEEQIRVIHNYDVSIGNIINTQQDNFILANFIEIEKNRARQLLENGKNILKKNLGYFPLEVNYNRKIEELFNKIINKKVIEYNSIKIGNRNYDELEYQIKKNNILEDEKRIMKELDYKSKYETIENSVPNFEKLDKMSQNSLIGFSKLVKIDENGDLDNNFLVTWRENMKKEDEKYNKNNNYNNDKIYKSYTNEKKNKKNIIENNKDYNNIKDELKIKDKKQKISLESPIKIRSTSHQKIKTTKVPNLIFPDIKKFEKVNEKPKTKSKNKSSSLLSLNIISKKSTNSVKEKESNNIIYNNSNNNIENNINNSNEDSPKIKEDKTLDHIIFSSNSQNNISENNQKLNEENNYNNIKSYNSLKEIEHSFNSTNNNYNSDNLESPINNNYLHHYSINQDFQSKNNFLEDKRYSTNYYNSPPLPHKKNKKKKYKKYNSNNSNNENDKNNIYYTEDNFREKKMPKLPQITKERIEQRPGTAALIHYKKNKKRNSSSDNDSILKDLDRFRQLALNDIGYLDNNHYNYYDSRPKEVDLIPKDVIRNYDRVISSGNSSGHSKRRNNTKYI